MTEIETIKKGNGKERGNTIERKKEIKRGTGRGRKSPDNF